MTEQSSQRFTGFVALLAFFLLACACPNPLSRNSTPAENPALSGVEFGQVVTAAAVGERNSPQLTTDSFATSDPIIYVVAEAQRVEQGTTLFARWFRDGQAFEDTPPITADRLYQDTFVEFHIEPDNSTTFKSGNYSVTLYVNGNPGPSVEFTVR